MSNHDDDSYVFTGPGAEVGYDACIAHMAHVPLEEVRGVLGALLEHLGLVLITTREYGDTRYEVMAQPKAQELARQWAKETR
jgi:hypothetical protein